MTTFTVTTAADVVNVGDDVLSLREAVQQANATAAADTIQFANALEGQTLALTGGQLTITSDVAIDGNRDNNATRVTLDGNAANRVIEVGGTGTDASLAGLNITNGRTLADADGAGILLGAGNALDLVNSRVSGNVAGEQYSGASGGGIHAGAGSRLTVSGSVLTGNSADDGGAIGTATGALLAVSGSTLDDNRAYLAGGAIATAADSTVRVTGSSLSGNNGGSFYGGQGGALFLADSRTTVQSSTIAGNGSVDGGGGLTVAGGRAAVLTSTVANNGVAEHEGTGFAGGIEVEGGGELLLGNSTVTGNSAGSDLYGAGGGIGLGYNARLSVFNSLVAGNEGGSYPAGRVLSDISGTITSSNGHNIFSSNVAGNVAGDRENVAPALVFAAVDAAQGGVLALNGGPTRTVALRNALDNPALSGAEPADAGDLDQRGFARPQPAASNPDLGAFELNQGVVSTAASARNDVLTGTAAANTLSGLAGNDLLVGLGGNDVLNGGDGGDSLRGGLGDDTLNGNAGQDTASYRDATAAVTANLNTQTASGALGSDRLAAIEDLEGGAGGDNLTGDPLANALAGRQGNDRLFGLLGDDRLYGGAGDDLLEGGFGDDRLDGGAGTDTISYFNDGGSQGIAANLRTGQVTRGGETDRLLGIENADGGNNADTLFGDGSANRLGGAGGADTLRGLGGDDVLNGGLGDDDLDGDAGRDLADYAAGGAVTVDLSGATDRATRGAEVDTLREIEGAIGSGNADTLRGDALTNLFRGQGGKDTMTGAAGSDLFDFDATSQSAVGANRDVVTDFTHLTDRLDLSTIDARAATTGANEAFTFLAARGAAFTAAGQVRWLQSGGNTLVEASTDADMAAEMQIQLTGLRTLGAGDFVL